MTRKPIRVSIENQSSRRAFLHTGLQWLGAGTMLPAAMAQSTPDNDLSGYEPASSTQRSGQRKGEAASRVTGNTSRRGMVVTVSPAASEAGLAILRDGGNAVDAAIAAMMACCVVRPSSVGFGGYGGTLLVYVAKTGQLEAIDFDSRAPLAFRPEIYAGQPKAASLGYLSIGVPGVVAGMDLALQRYGTRSFAQCATAAVALAEEGIPVDDSLAESLGRMAGNADAVTRRAVFPDGKIPENGQRWRIPELARSIRRIGQDPSQFYRGDIARQIVRQVRANGGILSDEDFLQYRPQVTKPLHVNYRGNDLYTPPPPSAGLTTLSILKTLENFDIARLGRWSAPYYHIVLEATRLCWEERARYFGDPDFVHIPIEELLSAEAAAKRAEMIRAGKRGRPAETQPAGEHTVNVVAADSQGNAISVTATHGNGFGSRVAIEGLGLFLGHGMSRFVLDPKSPDAPAPGKRMQHNMAPVIAVRNGRPTLLLGMPGGTKIPAVTAQMAVSIFDFGATPLEVAGMPRVHVETQEPALISPEVPAAVAQELEKMGHRLQRENVVGGVTNVIRIDRATGQMSGACSDADGGASAL